MIDTLENVTVVTDIVDAHFGDEEMPETIEHPETGETLGTPFWTSTDAWRGYWEIKPADGWQIVGTGTNCGDWDDAPAGTSNDECEAQIVALADEHDEVVVVVGGSSNVFSMAYDVLARVKS